MFGSYSATHIRQVAAVCVDQGFGATDTGYIMRPVSSSTIHLTLARIGKSPKVLSNTACRRYFAIVPGPQGSRPMVSADLSALIRLHQIGPALSQPVRTILSKLHRSMTYPVTPAVIASSSGQAACQLSSSSNVPQVSPGPSHTQTPAANASHSGQSRVSLPPAQVVCANLLVPTWHHGKRPLLAMSKDTLVLKLICSLAKAIKLSADLSVL